MLHHSWLNSKKTVSAGKASFYITVLQKVQSVNTDISERIYDEIKYIYKIATVKELTAIENIKKEFDRAWKELEKKGAAEVIENRAVGIKYKKEDLPQVNPQLYKWLSSVNEKSSVDTTVPQKVPYVNTIISENFDTTDGEKYCMI